MSETRNWSIGPWTRYERNERRERVAIKGAKITDRDLGVTYEATVGTSRGGAWLTSLTITTTDDRRINHALLTKVPTKAIADAVAANLREAEESEVSAVFRTQVRVTGDKPSMPELAHEYEHRTRQDLALLYGVSTSTIDRWVAEARSLSLIGPAKTGRPPAKNTHPGTEA